MKLTIKRAEFLKMLTFAAQAIPGKTAESQYMNFLLVVSQDALDVITSDGSISSKIHQEREDEKGNEVILASEEGSIQTPAKLLLDIISKLGGDIVTLELVDSCLLNISDESSNFNLVTKPGEEYPDVNLNVPEGANGFKVSLADLKSLFDTTSFAVAVKGPKELYQGINITALDGRLTFLATDSFRVASLSKPEASQDANFVFTCPVKPLDMITRASESGEVVIYLDEQKALFVLGKTVISTRLLHGNFPAIDRLIPPQFPFMIEMKTAEFIERAERVKIISSMEGRNSQVRLNLNKDSIYLYARSTNFGNSQETFHDVKITMPEDVNVFEIAFNVDFVMEAVKALKSETFTLCLSSPTKIFMVKNDDPTNIQIITPIRLSNY